MRDKVALIAFSLALAALAYKAAIAQYERNENEAWEKFDAEFEENWAAQREKIQERQSRIDEWEQNIFGGDFE